MECEMTHDPTRDCEHGRLKGKCDVCDLQAEVERLTELLNNPEEHYPGNFDTPQRANALLTGLCQDAAKEIAKLQYEVDAIPAIKEERDALAAELTRLKASIALDKMADNARELGLDYEPAVQEGRDWSLLEATQESLREHMAEIKRLKAAQPAPVQTWIDCKVQMPPPGVRVFFLHKDYDRVGFDMWFGDDFRWTPSHWMPIPPLTATPPEAHPALPKEWKLVPVEPTKEMIDRGRIDNTIQGRAFAEACYRAMLAAAPEKGQL
jgi:hypothetical protein